MTLIKDLLTKYKNMSAPLKASLWFIVCNIIQKGISLITTPIFTRLLTTEQYGTFSVFMSWYTIIYACATLNLSAGVYFNALTKYPEKRSETTSSFLGLSTTVTAVLFAVYLVNMDFWNNILNLSSLFIILMFLEILFVPAYSLWSVKQRYDYKYRKQIIITLLIAILNPAFGVVAVLSTEYKAEARIITSVLIQVVIGLIFYIYIFSKGKKFFSKEYWIFALRFNLPLLPHYLSMTALNQADKIMISSMISESAVALYSIAYTFSNVMAIVTNAINSSFIPFTYKALKAKNYKSISNIANFVLLIVMTLSVLTMAFGPEVIYILGGETYLDAIWVIPPVAASLFFTMLYSLFGNIEFYYEKTIGIMIASCTGAVANVILNYIFIPIFGYYAAGYTTLFCYMLFSFAHFLFQRKIVLKEIGEHVYSVKLIMLMSVSQVLIMIIMTLSYNWNILRYSIIVVVMLVLIIKRKLFIKKLKELKE